MATKDKGGAQAGGSVAVTLAEKALVRDLKQAAAPDVNRPFLDVKDAYARLLPFHVFCDEEPPYGLGYGRAVGRASFLLSSLPQDAVGISDLVGGYSLAEVDALVKGKDWDDISKFDADISEATLKEQVRRAEELQRRRDARLALLRRQLETVRMAYCKASKGLEEGSFRGEEVALLAKWLVEDEREKVVQLQQREALRQQQLQLQKQQQQQQRLQDSGQQQAQQEEEQEEDEVIGEDRRQSWKRSSPATAAPSTVSATAHTPAQDTPLAAQAQSQNSWLALGPSPPEAGAQAQGQALEEDSPRREDLVATDLLSQFAATPSRGNPDSGSGGLKNPPMSQEDLLVWTAEGNDARDGGMDWLGGPGIMDLNLDLQGQDNFFGQEGTPKGGL